MDGLYSSLFKPRPQIFPFEVTQALVARDVLAPFRTRMELLNSPSVRRSRENQLLTRQRLLPSPPVYAVTTGAERQMEVRTEHAGVSELSKAPFIAGTCLSMYPFYDSVDKPECPNTLSGCVWYFLGFCIFTLLAIAFVQWLS